MLLRRTLTAILALALFSAAADAAQQPTSSKITLKQGKSVTLSNGVTLSLDHVLYAHFKGGGNLSRCQLKVHYEGKVATVVLERLHGKAPAKTYDGVPGMKLRLEGVDAYHKPSTAWILVVIRTKP